MTTIFTPESRARTLEILTRALSEQEETIAAGLLVGSGATGFRDRWSDIDVAVVVSDGTNPVQVGEDWSDSLSRLLPVRGVSSRVRGELALVSCALEDHLHIDMTFRSRSNLAGVTSWSVMFDHTGQIETSLLAAGTAVDLEEARQSFRHRLDTIWHFVAHGAVSIHRGDLWRAMHYVDEVRKRAFEMEGVASGCGTHHSAELYQLPADRLAIFEGSLVGSVRQEEISRALRIATDCFFKASERAEQRLGENRVESVRTELYDYLQAIGFRMWGE